MHPLQARLDTLQPQAGDDIRVCFADGHYALQQSLKIGPRPTGAGGSWIRLQAAEGATPVLSGARMISGWECHDAEKNIWKAAVPAGSDFEHLWWGRRRLARTWSGWNPPGFKNCRQGLQMTAQAPDVARWKNTQDIVVTKKMMWRKIPARVDRIAGQKIFLDPKELASYPVPSTALGVMEPPSLYGLLNLLEPRSADFALENAYELLTDEGEWYLDRAEDTVYFKPFSDQAFSAKSTLTYAGVNSLILLDGKLQTPVSRVEIRGLRFEYAKGSKLEVSAGFPTEPTKAITPPACAALQINRGQQIRLLDNQFLHMGHDAVHFDLGGGDFEISGNAFIDISRSALSLNQTNLIVSNASKLGVLPANADKFFENIEIRNNYMRCSGIDTPAPAVSYSEFTRKLRFIHNEVSHCAIQAIRTSWRYLGWRGHCGDIEYAWNRTSDVGQDGLHDFGALYVACANAGYTRIHHNFIDGVGVNPANAGIYMDVFVDSAEIYNNLSVNQPKEDFWNRLSRGWVVLVMSKNSRVRDNWSDQLSYRDFDQGRYRFFRHDRSNQRRNNQLIGNVSKLPADAREVADKAGLEVDYRAMKTRVETLMPAPKFTSSVQQPPDRVSAETETEVLQPSG